MKTLIIAAPSAGAKPITVAYDYVISGNAADGKRGRTDGQVTLDGESNFSPCRRSGHVGELP